MMATQEWKLAKRSEIQGLGGVHDRSAVKGHFYVEVAGRPATRTLCQSAFAAHKVVIALADRFGSDCRLAIYDEAITSYYLDYHDDASPDTTWLIPCSGQ